MDTSETYIKQCEKATRIQQGHELHEGDYFAYLRPVEGKLWGKRDREDYLKNPASIVELIHYDGDGAIDHIYTQDIEHCWLPRQDQLQEMVRSEGDLVMDDLNDFMSFAKLTPHTLNSMESLWLAFIMQELYSKCWNGEDWANT